MLSSTDPVLSQDIAFATATVRFCEQQINNEIILSLFLQDGLDTIEPINLQAAILDTIMHYDSQDSHDYLAAIFSDDNYADHHHRFFLSETPARLGLQARDFPLIALRLHYTNQQVVDDVIGLWEEFIDQDLVIETNFLKFESNLNLISHIFDIKDQLITAEKVSQHPQRYKRLLLILELYRTIGFKISELGILLNRLITYNHRRQWANDCIDSIVNFIAYPNGSQQMHFQNVNHFLGLSIDRPYENNFYGKHPNLNANYVNALIHKFMQLFIQKESALSDAQTYKVSSIPLGSLPSLCQGWLDLSLIRKYILLPIFAETMLTHKLECIYSQDLGRAIITLGTLASAAAFIRSFDSDDEQMAPLFNIMNNLTGQQSNFNPQIRFMQELYYAYCLNQKALNASDCNNDYLDLYSIPDLEGYKKNQVAAFIKIYSALREAQSGFFKTDWIAKNNLKQIPVDDALALIEEHSRKPNSRTQTAWKLAKKYKYEAVQENISLIKKIYAYGFSQSGLFKLSTSLHKTFIRSSALNEALSMMTPESINECIGDSNSRLDKVARALRR
jgi:hypothetical protein